MVTRRRVGGLPTQTGEEYFFSLDSGSIVVTDVTGERPRGTFTATGGYARTSPVPPLTRDTFAVVIADGTFDLPFVACCPY